jgi:uncharacterized membrane protein
MSNSTRRRSLDTERLVYFSLFTALVVILQCMASFVFPKIGLSLNLSLIPIVLGVALCGRYTGAWLGFVSAFIILFDPTTAGFMTFNAPATIFLVLFKGVMAGLVAGLVYDLFFKMNKTLAVFLAAVAAPIVNTGIFLAGSFIFYVDLVVADAGGANALGHVLTV